MKSLRDYLIEAEMAENTPAIGDFFDIEIARDETIIETYVVDVLEDGIVIEADDEILRILSDVEYLSEDSNMPTALDSTSPIHSTYRDEFSDDDDLDEAKYRGREVPLNKKMPGDIKKSKVYVRKPNGNIVKVEFGDPNMRIKKSNPKRRKSFRARHNCANPGPKWKARYWSCRSW